jgi:hypothetical protein
MKEREVVNCALEKYNDTFRPQEQKRISLETAILGANSEMQSIDFINLMLIIEEVLSEKTVYQGDIFSLIAENEHIATPLDICEAIKKSS